jgi:hypothetical protein
MSHVIGILDSAPLANQAILGLLDLGLTKDDISLIMSDKTKANFVAATKDTGDRAVVDTAIGAGTGGVLGAILAGLTTAGAIFIPGVSLVVAGPLIALLTGVGAGATVGGLAGALSAAGIAMVEKMDYHAELKAGKAVIVAHTKSDAQAQAARAVLMDNGAMMKPIDVSAA